MSMTFSGQVALVTGAAAGIGRATAQAFAAEGMKVVVADLDVAGRFVPPAARRFSFAVTSPAKPRCRS